eukprot:2223230-Rhodomonas_salina.1
MLDALRTTISGHSASVPCMESDAMAFHVMITSSAWSAQDCAKILATRARCWSRSGEEEEEDEERNNALLHLAIFSADRDKGFVKNATKARQRHLDLFKMYAGAVDQHPVVSMHGEHCCHR